MLPALGLSRPLGPTWQPCGFWLGFVRIRSLRVLGLWRQHRIQLEPMPMRQPNLRTRKKSSRASRKLAQLASEAFSAGRPKRSQLLRSSTFQAGSDMGDTCGSDASRLLCLLCRGLRGVFLLLHSRAPSTLSVSLSPHAHLTSARVLQHWTWRLHCCRPTAAFHCQRSIFWTLLNRLNPLHPSLHLCTCASFTVF